METNSTYKIHPIQPRKVEWQNLSFSSVSEVKIAQALDRVGVLFFPNCRGRLTTTQGRRNRECDFLVCYEGIWGILEVDGEPYHPALSCRRRPQTRWILSRSRNLGSSL
jgi:hypothetical protein